MGRCPLLIFQNRVPSDSFANFESVRLAGRLACLFAIGPFPLPVAPWQGMQLRTYTCLPVAREPSSGGIGFFFWASRAEAFSESCVTAGGSTVTRAHADTLHATSATPPAIPIRCQRRSIIVIPSLSRGIQWYIQSTMDCELSV